MLLLSKLFVTFVTLCNIVGMAKEDKKTEYGALRLKKDTIEYLKDAKLAFESSYLQRFTFDEFARRLVACVEDAEPAVWEALGLITGKKSREE